MLAIRPVPVAVVSIDRPPLRVYVRYGIPLGARPMTLVIAPTNPISTVAKLVEPGF